MNPRDGLQNNLPKFEKNVSVIKDEERLGLKKTERCNKLNATHDPGLHLGTEKKISFLFANEGIIRTIGTF